MTQATPHALEPGYWLPEEAYEQIRTARATAETLLDFLDAMNGDRVELTIGGLREMLAGSIVDNLNLNPFETFPCPRPERSAMDERVDRGIQAVLGDLFTRPTSRWWDLRRYFEWLCGPVGVEESTAAFDVSMTDRSL